MKSISKLFPVSALSCILLLISACTQPQSPSQAPTDASITESGEEASIQEEEIEGLPSQPENLSSPTDQTTTTQQAQLDITTLRTLLADLEANNVTLYKELTTALDAQNTAKLDALKTELQATSTTALEVFKADFTTKNTEALKTALAIQKIEQEEARNTALATQKAELEAKIVETEETKKFVPPDTDIDGIVDAFDNCPFVANPEQRTLLEGAERGDVCNPDVDNDSILDRKIDQYGEPLPGKILLEERYGYGENKLLPCTLALKGSEGICYYDNCPYIANLDQKDTDRDGRGDACVGDDDGDGVRDTSDNCPEIPNPDQAKTLPEAPGGDACYYDWDMDSIENTVDNCPKLANKDQLNFDGDEFGDVCDEDNDNDGSLNKDDTCPYLASVGSGGDPRKCNDIIEGVMNTILSPPEFNNRDYEGYDWRNYIKDYAVEPKGFYAITGLSAIKVYNGKDSAGEDYKVYYISLFKKPNVYIAKAQIVDGQVVPALTVSYPIKTDFITSMQTMTIGAGVNKKTYLLFLTESIENDLSTLSTENLWRVEIQPEDYGRILLHTLTRIDLGAPFKDMDVNYRVPFNQLSLGIKEKEDGTGAVAFISQPQLGVVYAMRFTPQPDGTLQTSAPEALSITGIHLSITGIQMVEPRSTFVTGTYLYIGTNGSIVRASLDENGNLIQSSILSIPLDSSVKSSPIGGFAKLDSDSQIFFNIHGNRWISPFPTGGTSSLYAIPNMGQIKRLTRSDLMGTGVGYGDFVPGAAEPALVGMHTPAGMSSDGNHLLIVDKGNRAIRDIELAVTKQSISVKKSSYVVGQISEELTHLPKDGKLNNFYWPQSIVVAHEKGSPISYAFVKSRRGITRFGGHGGLCSMWKATLREDVVETMEQISIACWECSDMALYNAPDEFRLYTFSPSGNSLEVMTFDKKDGSPKIPSTTIYHHTSFLLKFAATPNGKHLFAIEKPGNDIRNLIKLDINPASAEATITSPPTVYKSPSFPWTMPTNISIYTEGSKDYLLVIDKSIFHSTCTWDWSNGDCSDRLYRVEIGANGELVPETAELLAGGGTKTPTKDGVDPSETRFITLGTAKYVDGTIWITHPRHETSIYKLDLNKKKVHFVFQVPWCRYLPFDGEGAQIGSDWMGLHTFDVLQFGNIKGLLFLDMRNHALRLLR